MNLYSIRFLVVFIYIFLLNLTKYSIESLRLRGTFHTNEFFKFLTRFGIQSTDMHEMPSTLGYIYGNITLVNSAYFNSTDQLPQNLLLMLTVMDYNFFIDYYNKRLVTPKTLACPMMFEKIDKTAYFFECNENGIQDFVRRVPCATNKLCLDEDKPNRVIKNHQFTFKIRDFNQPRFWYISLVACVRENCEWRDLESQLIDTYKKENGIIFPKFTIDYDIWLVNGDPNSEGRNRLEHQFSYELHDIIEIYLCSFLIYLFILPFILYRLKYHFHNLYLLLFIYMVFELLSRFISLIHYFTFSVNGEGIRSFQILGDFMETFASTILILILILISKGWTIRFKYLKLSKKFFILGLFLQIVLILSHSIAIMSIDPVFNANPYQTIAGYFELGTRFVFMVWFLLELIDTFNYLNSTVNITNATRSEEDKDFQNRLIDDENCSDTENNKQFENYSKDELIDKYKSFYLHYGACCLVWFIYLPMLIFVTSFVSELFRLRLIISIRYFVNFLSVVVLLYIMWSPKTPLKIPGKKSILKHDTTNVHYLNDEETDENFLIINDF